MGKFYNFKKIFEAKLNQFRSFDGVYVFCYNEKNDWLEFGPVFKTNNNNLYLDAINKAFEEIIKEAREQDLIDEIVTPPTPVILSRGEDIYMPLPICPGKLDKMDIINMKTYTTRPVHLLEDILEDMKNTIKETGSKSTYLSVKGEEWSYSISLNKE